MPFLGSPTADNARICLLARQLLCLSEKSCHSRQGWRLKIGSNHLAVQGLTRWLNQKRSHFALHKFVAAFLATILHHMHYSGSADGPRYGEKGPYGPDIVPKVFM
jgi:hypothetical protein